MKGASALALLVPCMLGAQSAGHAADAGHARAAPPLEARVRLDSLVALSARLAARYADRRAALVDGYRRVGDDFPGMGEHWVHTGALIAGGVNPARPTLLTYATLDGRPRLLGLGFVVTTQGGAPPDVPGWPFAWHEHSGLLADESGAAPGRSAERASATRVWVLHAWTAMENPEGPYAPDNWALPFVRLGLAAPAGVDASAGRALSLAAGGEAFLRGVLADAGLLAAAGPAGEAEADAALGEARERAAAVAARARAAGRATTEDLAELRAAWASLGSALRSALGPGVAPLLAPPHAPAH